MSEGLHASRKTLEADRTKTVNEIATLDERIATDTAALELLTTRRAFLQAKADQLTEGINALRAAERDVP